MQIRDIQGFLGPDAESGDDTPPSISSDDPDVVFDTGRPLTMEDFCRILPERRTVDRLLSDYFSEKYMQLRKFFD